MTYISAAQFLRNEAQLKKAADTITYLRNSVEIYQFQHKRKLNY